MWVIQHGGICAGSKAKICANMQKYAHIINTPPAYSSKKEGLKIDNIYARFKNKLSFLYKN